MGDVLFRDGQVVFDGGQVVFTDDPENCICCGHGFVYGESTCGTGNVIKRPRRSVLTVAGAALGSGYASFPPVALGREIGDCGLSDGTPVFGWPPPPLFYCLEYLKRRIYPKTAICGGFNQTHLLWDEDECGASAWNCVRTANAIVCDFDAPPIDGVSGETGLGAISQHFLKSGSVSYVQVGLSSGGSFGGGSAFYTNFAAGGFPLVSGVYNTLGTHVLVRTSYTQVYCSFPPTVTLVLS